MGATLTSNDVLARLEAIAALGLALFREAGAERVEPPILSPADESLDLYGEEIWDRDFVVDDHDRGAWRLRPDFTAPIARSHLKQAADGGPVTRRYAYAGPVFRRPLEEDGAAQPAQHLQIGLEILGEPASPELDAELFHLIREAVAAATSAPSSAVIGDLSVMFSLLDALELPEIAAARLKRHFWRPERFGALLDELGRESGPTAARASLLKAIGAMSPAEATLAVGEMIALGDTPEIGVRSAREVAERLLSQAADARRRPSPPSVLKLVDAARRVVGPAPAAIDALRRLTREAGLSLETPLDAVEARLAAFAARGVAPDALIFDADFGRNLQYYDGFVFEFRGAAADGRAVKLAGGGRYDSLFRALGQADPSLARVAKGAAGVGAALRPESILAAEATR